MKPLHMGYEARPPHPEAGLDVVRGQQPLRHHAKSRLIFGPTFAAGTASA